MFLCLLSLDAEFFYVQDWEFPTPDADVVVFWERNGHTRRIPAGAWVNAIWAAENARVFMERHPSGDTPKNAGMIQWSQTVPTRLPEPKLAALPTLRRRDPRPLTPPTESTQTD